MKILWLTPQFPIDSKSIKGIYIYRTVKYLSKFYDITTCFYYPQIPPILKILLNPKKGRDLLRYWRKNSPSNNPNLDGILNEKLLFLKYFRLPRGLFHHIEAYFIYYTILLKNIDLKEISIIHANWIYPSGHLAFLLSKKYKIPFSVSLLGTDVHKLKKGTKYWKVAKRIVEKADVVTSVSQELIDRCVNMDISIPVEKTIILDNIYDTNKFKIFPKNELRQKYSFNENEKIYFFVGGLVEIKNVDILIQAFNLLDDKNSRLLIAGDGPDKLVLEQIVKKINLVDRVQFLGNLNEDKLIAFYNLSDILCLPSKNEGTPNVIIEALLCGLPIVATNVGGIPQLIKIGVNGFLVEPNNIDSLAEYLKVSSSTKWDRKKLRNSAERFFPDNVKHSYDKLFTKLNQVIGSI